MKYEKSKFYCANVEYIKDPTVWWTDEYVEKKEFRMTKGYKEFLKAKRKLELEKEIKVLRSKLEYQTKTYGFTDELDVSELMAKIEAYSKM